MKITSVITEFSTNTYFIYGDEVTVVIDPGGSTQDLIAELEREGRKPDFVLVTHGHYDHTYSCAAMQKLGAKIFMSHLDTELVENGGHVKFMGKIIEKFDFETIKDGDILGLGDLKFEVMSTSGHTLGSVCYVLDNNIFSGDTLFAGTIGRTDLPGGSNQNMAQSLKKLALLDKDYNIFAGHGRQSTLNKEKVTNPFLK